jgi:hypothetical protein
MNRRGRKERPEDEAKKVAKTQRDDTPFDD